MSQQGDALRQSGQAADASFSGQPAGSPQQPCKTKSWVDFRLVDPDGKPVANMRFKLKDTEGREHTGVTDADGCAGVDGIDPGDCQIEFLGAG